MKIGILYICTGGYEIFFEKFFISSEKHFLVNHEKRYFVWTDSKKDIFKNEKIKINKQKKLGWPLDTLMRFHFFLKESELINYDYLFFFNANMVFLDTVGDEILPTMSDNGLTALTHPGYVNNNLGEFETNSYSTAYFVKDKKAIYYQACFFGGLSDKFIEICKVCKQNIDLDLKNGIVAIWHDESHLNKYFYLNPPKNLNPTYGWPESWETKEKIKVTQIDKSRLPGGHFALRKSSFYLKIRNKIKLFIYRII